MYNWMCMLAGIYIVVILLIRSSTKSPTKMDFKKNSKARARKKLQQQGLL